MTDLPEKIFNLLSRKSFDDLTNEERILAKEYLTKEDYEDFRKTILDFETVDDDLSIGLGERPKKKPAQKGIFSLFQKKIPIYQAAAAVVAVFAISFAWQSSQTGNAQGVDSHAVQIDTLHVVGKSLADEDYPEELVFEM